MRLGSRRVGGFVLGAGMVMALAGCTAQQASTGQGAAGYPNADAKQGAPQAAPVQPNGKAQAPAVTVGAAGFQERKLVRTAKVEMTSTDVTAAVDRARQIAIGVGGYTGAESTGQGSATLTLAVPSDKLDVVIGQVVTVGTVTGREQNAQDVTDQTADIEAVDDATGERRADACAVGEGELGERGCLRRG
jgi:hypothetical protein